jgi:formylglycine-generating enzyme required for sulfatase activity
MKPDFSYPYTPDDDRELLTASRDIRRVVRGGSFFDSDYDVECSRRGRHAPNGRHEDYGFRVILSPL